MNLFDDIERNYHGYRGETESEFAFINRSAKPLFSRTRELLQGWFDDVKANGDDKKDLKARFRSDDEKPHVAAFFELYCHALLRYQSYDVEVHQSADETTSRVPDFCASRSGERLFYLESTLAADTFMDEKSQARLDNFLEGLVKLDSPNYGISMDYDEGPEHQPSSKKARQFLKEKLGQLEERAAKTSSWPSGDGIEWEYEDGGWKVRFSPILRAPEVRGKPGQRLIVMGTSGGIVSPEGPLYASIKKKAAAYGNLTKPYIIAVDTLDDFADEHDVLDALVGKTGYRVDRNVGKVFVARNPRSGAAFRDPQGNPSNTRVSAVLVAYGVTASRLATSETPVLWHNPWAKNTLDPGLWQGPQVFINPDTFELKKRPGLDYHDHLRKHLGYQDPLLDD
jgi:hypothetical protein